jgi:hypothetical protein
MCSAMGPPTLSSITLVKNRLLQEIFRFKVIVLNVFKIGDLRQLFQPLFNEFNTSIPDFLYGAFSSYFV